VPKIFGKEPNKGTSMTRKVVIFAAALVLTVGACGAGPDPSAARTASVARPLAYSLTDDVALDYHVTMDMGMTTTFGDAFRALDPSMPGAMDTTMEMEFDSSYRVTPGEDPGTHRVTMGLSNMKLGGGGVTMGSDSFDFSDLPQGELDSVLESQVAEVGYVINERGEILSMEIAGVPFDVSGILGGTSSAGGNTAQMFGPQLPEGVVNVGDSWTTAAEQQLPGMDPIITEQVHTILRREDRAGYDTWVIRTESSTGAYTITWDDMVAMAESLGGLGELGIDDTMPPAFQMSMRSSPTGASTLTWFEPELGLTIAQDVSTNLSMTMEMAGLPNTGGRSVSMGMTGFTHMLMELER
jgi:hypothetical protein